MRFRFEGASVWIGFVATALTLIPVLLLLQMERSVTSKTDLDDADFDHGFPLYRISLPPLLAG